MFRKLMSHPSEGRSAEREKSVHLYLHVGHGKTGSSALQSFLALNNELLREFGVFYAEHASFAAAKERRISSGNLPLKAGWERYIDSVAQRSDANILLFSNESLIHKLLEDPSAVKRLKAKYKPVLVLYVRDPLDHVFSAYGQQVKRHGYAGDLASWIDNYQVLDRVIGIIDLCQKLSVDIRIRNYSRVREIEESFIRLLLHDRCDEFMDAATIVSAGPSINRSLSRVEYELQRAFNKRLGSDSARFISDALVNNAPNIEAEREFIEREVLEEFARRQHDKVVYINRFLDDSERLRMPINYDISQGAGKYEISGQQIDVIAESISKEILRAKESGLADHDADSLRDIALKYETGEHLSRQEARYLMELASKARPNGPLIRKKLDKYSRSA